MPVKCVADLAPDQAEALLLHHEWEFSFEEIAKAAGSADAGDPHKRVPPLSIAGG